MSSKNVVVTLELGHRATVRSQRTDEGFTHDWEVFVQGANGARIEAFIEKIVFTLHKSFAKPKRILKVPPYRVNEKGYGGFTMPIEITFKTNHPEDTRKTCFEYDLYLQHVDNPPINNMRKEKLTFLKPSEDFRKKLLQGGGVTDHEQSAPVKKMTSPKNNALVSMMAHEESNTNDKGGSVSRPSGGAKIKPQNAQQSHSDGSKKHKHPPVKETKTKQESKASDQFSALFGEPIKKISEQKKVSKEKPKEKEKEKVIEKHKEKLPPPKSSDKQKTKDKSKTEKTSSSSSSGISHIPPQNNTDAKEEKRDKEKDRNHKDRHKKDRDKDRDKHKKERDREKENKKNKDKESTKKSASPLPVKPNLSPAPPVPSKRLLSPSSKRSTSPASKRSLSPTNSIKSDSSAKRKKYEHEISKKVQKLPEESKDKKEKKKDKKEKKKSKEEPSIVEAEKEKPIEKVIIKTDNSTKISAPVIKEEKPTLPPKVEEKLTSKEHIKKVTKSKKGFLKEMIKEEPPPPPVVKKKNKEKQIFKVTAPIPSRSRSSSKSTSRSSSPSPVCRSRSPECSRSSKSSRSRSPPSPDRDSPSRSRSRSRSLSPARSKSRSRSRSPSRSSSESRRTASRSPSLSGSKSRSPSRSVSRSRSRSRSKSRSRSRSRSRGRSRSPSGSRSPSSSPVRSKSRSTSGSPTRSVTSSSSVSSPSHVSVGEAHPAGNATRGGAGIGRGTNAVGGAKNPLRHLMELVTSSDSEVEDRMPTIVKREVKPPLKSSVENVRSSHPPASQSAATTPQQIKKEPESSSDDDDIVPPIREGTKGSAKREAPAKKPQTGGKKKRRSAAAEPSPPAKSKVSVPIVETTKPIKEEIKSEPIKNVKEESAGSPRLSPEYLQELAELHQKIMNSVNAVDRQKIQQVVDIVAEHSSFSLTHAHFNFDLSSLDVHVVKQLQGCFS